MLSGGRSTPQVQRKGSYLPCCVASVCRLRATSAQASTAPCRVCRSGLCVIDSRRGNTAKHTVGETPGVTVRHAGSGSRGGMHPLSSIIIPQPGQN